jgi:serine/threonine-protein kinase
MPDDDPLLGRTLAGRYRLISTLGEGGMSSVYLARHVLIDRLGAIKILRDELVRDPLQKERFLREARAVNRINHPGIVEISDYGETQIAVGKDRRERRSVVYLVMEYVPGESLQRVLSRERLGVPRVLAIVAQVAAALARAHQTGVIHRDVKPDNVLLVPRRDGGDLAKLTDFGVARLGAPGRVGATDQVFGTPGYLAPEYLLGGTGIDGRADLYSLGILAYEALTGALPFEGETPEALLSRPLVDEPTHIRVRRPDVPQPVADLIMRCLQRRPEDRPRDAFALLDELDAAAAAIGVRPFESLAPSGERRESMAPREGGGGGGGGSGGGPRHTPYFGSAFGDATTPAEPVVVDVPKLGEVGHGELPRAWREALRALDARVTVRGVATEPRVVASRARIDVLLGSLDAAVDLLLTSQRAVDELSARGRDFRGTIGRAIDQVAHDLSKAHAEVLAHKRRRVELHLARRHEADPGRADALLWEEAAVDDDLRAANARTLDLGARLESLQDDLYARNNEHETELLQASGALEGQAAALMTLQREIEAEVAEIVAALVAAS